MKRKKSPYSAVLNVVCLILLIGSAVYLAVRWHAIPDTVPAHYNAAGEVDRWSGKGEILILPVINWVLYFMITGVECAPKLWNTGVKVTAANEVRVYKILGDMISSLKILMTAIFTYVTVNTALASALSPLFFPLTVILVFGTLIYYLIKLHKAR